MLIILTKIAMFHHWDWGVGYQSVQIVVSIDILLWSSNLSTS
jgi:hypothetical protein